MTSYEIEQYYDHKDNKQEFKQLYDYIEKHVIKLRKLNCDWDNIQVFYLNLLNDICYNIEIDEICNH